MTAYVHHWRLLGWICVVWLVSGCTAMTLREAQEHFNKGADLELRALDRSLLSDHPDANPGDAFAALNEYRLTHAVATRLIAKQARVLQQDKLLGATYVLKAMTLWRIADLEGDELAAGEIPTATQPAREIDTPRQELLAMLRQIEQLSSAHEITLGTRDRVLHKALYGFYDHEGGRAENDYAKARQWFDSAYTRLNDSLAADIPQRHPIRVYVGSAQLRTLAAWNLALYNARKHCRSHPTVPHCALLSEDQGKINNATKHVVCQLQPFWDGKEEVKNPLTALVLTVGLPSVFNQCTP